MENMNIVNSEYKILIVDDIVSNILLLKVLLLKEGFDIVMAMSGREALEVVDREQPNLILLDVMMPEMDGFEVASRLRASSLHSHIPIIFLTALNGVTDVVKGFQNGGNDFISKPFNKEELIIRVTHQLSVVAAGRIIEQQNDELRRTIAGRDKLYSVIANDLRAPLTSVKNTLNELAAEKPDGSMDGRFHQMLDAANRTTDDIFALLDNLLKWTRSQIGRMNVKYGDIDIKQFIKEIAESFSTSAQAKDIHIVLDLPEGDVTAYADADMLDTVLRNLLSNAVKYSYEGGEVTVKVSVNDDEITIGVTDHGCGIDEEDQSKLLQQDTHFSRLGTNDESGSGLGLLLSRDFVRRNQGELWFSSTPGKGSTFNFSVPSRESVAG